MADAAALEFDTFAATREIVAAGLERQQAEAITVTGRAGLATKAHIDSLNARFDAKISGLEPRMLRAAIAIVLTQTALTAALTAGLTFGLLRMFGGAPWTAPCRKQGWTPLRLPATLKRSGSASARPKPSHKQCV